MSNNITNSAMFGGYTLSTIEQTDGSHAIQLVEVPPGASANLIGSDLFGSKYSRAQQLTDNSYALNLMLISY
jgi:hypothetical protein